MLEISPMPDSLFKHWNNVLNIYADWDEVKVNTIQIYDVFVVDIA